LLLEYAHRQKIIIDDWVAVEISSRRNTKERRIDELLVRLTKGDTLLVAELSRLGRNMLETLNIIHALTENGVSIIFIRQPELSTTGPHTKLLMAIYSYFAESERDFISIRTKTGLAAARASGIRLGRPKGARSKNRILDPYKTQIADYLRMRLNLTAIHKIINNQLPKPITHQALKYFVDQDEELTQLRQKK
jgi:DNA invertase Pin-like site-specific DNA recombinase